jgi:hypothetical protein
MSLSLNHIARSETERMSLLEGIERPSLLQMVEAHVLKWTHNRIRNLSVTEEEGRYLVCGQVPSHHTKQLALHGALELLSSEQFSSDITVLAVASRSAGDV